MRDIQESVARNRVQVYSPTRRIARPAGGVANAGTAQTILGGGGSPPMPQVGTANFGRAAAPTRLPGWTQALAAPGGMPAMPGGAGFGTTLDQIRRQTGGVAAPQVEEPGGFWGSGIGKALGTAVNNPVGRGVLGVLDAFNYPRRVIQSTALEASDILTGGDTSLTDWVHQIGDEGFDAQDFLPETGVGWLDGVLGFGADMAMDPMTYVGGAGVWSGIAGRSARAGTAATARSLGVKVAGLTVQETEEKIARYGFSRFSNAARQELREQLPGVAKNILDRGYHFKVPLTDRFFQIPGTAPIDWLTSRGAGAVRNRLSDSPLGGWMRYASNPDGMRDAITTMVTRRPTGGLSFAQAAEVINFNNGKKLAQRSFAAHAVRMADDVVKAAGGGRQGREALNDLYRRAEAKGGTTLHEYFANLRKMVGDEYGVHVPEFETAYLPHFRTKQGAELLEAGESQAARDFKNLLYKDVDLNAPASVKMRRDWVAGSKVTIGGTEHQLVTGSADEINRIFRKALDTDIDLIDTDFASVAHRYIKSLEENVGVIGGLKKVLGSKTGLVHKLGDRSMLDMLTDEQIDTIASGLTAGALKNQRRQVSTTLRTMRDDTRRGIKGVGGSLNVEMRGLVDEMATVSAANKTVLDDSVRRLGELEDQVGVGKYHERFLDGDPLHGPPGRVGTIEQEYQAAHTLFTRQHEAITKRWQELEAKRGRLQSLAVAEARRIEAQGGVGATPIADELRRVSNAVGEASGDMMRAQAIIDRLDVNRQAQDVINARLGDSDFVNLSVGDNLSPKSPGSPIDPDTPAAPVYVGPAPAEISTDFNAKTTSILGATDEQVAEVAARFEVQNRAVDQARTRRWQTQQNYGEAADTAHQALKEGRRYEAGLKFEIDRTRGKPELLQRQLEYSDQLDAFQEGELLRLQRDYVAAKRPIEQADGQYQTELKKLQEIRDEQMQIARNMDARRTDPPAPPLTPKAEAALKSQRRRTVMARNKWQRTPEGVAHTKATKAHAAVTKTLESTNRQVDEITRRGGRFYIDADGVVQPKYTTKEQWALDLMEHRRSTLVPARDAAKAADDAATETWARLQRQGLPLESGEVKAALAEMKVTFKARKDAEYAVTRANRELMQVRDIPDVGRVTKQVDELNQLLAKQASQKARVDELAHELATSGQTLHAFEDEIAGINSQLDLQQTARDLAANPPATPYGAQVAANHRAELQRLEQVEARFAAPRTWDDPSELPATPSTNLGRFEGQFEDPTINRALEVIGRSDGRRRLFDDMDEVVDLQNSAAAIRAAAEPFTVPPVGTPAHTAVMEFSPASRGGAMGAVDRGQAVAAQTQRVLDRHIPELVEAGALPAEYADELFRKRLDLDRAMDVYAANPSAHLQSDITAQASDLGRLTEFALRYKQALDGGNEASPGLASFLLARQLDDEAVSLRTQIDIGNARLASPAGAAAELSYGRGLARMNERAVELSDKIEGEIARGRAGGDWDKRAVEGWTRELDQIQHRRDNLGQPANGALDDAVDNHAAYLADDLHDLNDAERIVAENRYVDHRMQWPVRRRDELTAAIPHREAQVQQAVMSQRRLEEGIRRAHASGSQTVRYTPYTNEGFNGKVAEMSLAQAEQNLVSNQRVIDTLEADLVVKQVQSSVLEGTAQDRITLLERELSDVEVPPNPVELAAENNTIRETAQREQRALTPGELETVASNQARVERLNRGQPLPQSTVASMQEEAARLRKAVDDFDAVMAGDAAHVSIARDPEPFLRGVAAGGGPLSERSLAMLGDLVGPETAQSAKVWIHYIDETFAGRTAVTAGELDELITDAVGTFGDNELIERMRQRAVASLADDGTVSLDEMRDEFTAALTASANRQRGEAMRETLSMQSLFGSSYVDGPGGMRPRHIDAISDEPSHQLLTARLRSRTLEAMQAKGFDPRNAYLDEVADLRTRLGRVETMRRGIDGNEEWLDVLLTGTPSAQARAETRATLQAGAAALEGEEQQLLAEGADVLNRLDPDRTTRLAEQQAQLQQTVDAGEQAIRSEMDDLTRQTADLQRTKDAAERTYTERLNEAGMQLANVRRQVVDASVDYRTFEAHRTQLVRALEADPSKSTESMRAAVDDLRSLNQARRELIGQAPPAAAATPPPTAAAPPPPTVGGRTAPNRLTPEEAHAGWGDTRPATPTEHAAAVKIAQATQARRAAGEDVEMAWYIAHGGGTSGLGNVQLPKDMPAPRGFYRALSGVGPEKLANDLGIPTGLAGINIKAGSRSGLSGDQRVQKLWDLGYRDASDLGGVDPEDIIMAGRPYQAAPAPSPSVSRAIDEANINAIDAQLVAYAEDLNKMDALATTEQQLRTGMYKARQNAAQSSQIIKDLTADGWRIMAKGIGVDDPDGYLISAGLAKAIENVQRGTEQGALWTFLDRYTAFFKTYATAKPGFHVRNAMSATFMNLVDGVRIRDMYEGARLWRQYERNPGFLATADQRVRDAFDAVAASGAGGRYAEAAFGTDIKAGTKMYQRVMDNALTRWNQRLGGRVEGSARLAMALNTMYRGGNATDAMARIAKFHFDYTEMSGLDRMARRFIPFWTFMSRNLPLQLEQMFTNPRMYLQYQSLVRNFGQPMDSATPEYWLSAGAFTVDKHAETREAPWYIAPDLPHLQVTEPLDAMARGEWGKAFLSDVNPLILAPLEAGAIGHKVFSDASLEGYEETSAANPFVPLFNLIGAATPFDATATAGSGATVVDKRAAHIARSLIPPWEFAERLLDPTGKRAGRTDETIYRALGVPARQLTDDLRRSTEQGRYYDRREDYQTQADLARM